MSSPEDLASGIVEIRVMPRRSWYVCNEWFCIRKLQGSEAWITFLSNSTFRGSESDVAVGVAYDSVMHAGDVHDGAGKVGGIVGVT